VLLWKPNVLHRDHKFPLRGDYPEPTQFSSKYTSFYEICFNISFLLTPQVPQALASFDVKKICVHFVFPSCSLTLLEEQHICVKFDISMAVNIWIGVFLVVKPFSLVGGYQRFGWT
jgi:hypothetical protein